MVLTGMDMLPFRFGPHVELLASEMGRMRYLCLSE